jgi:hypothetical protein
MKVKELIELLQGQDPEKEVFIQQGEEVDYMVVYSVREKELINDDEWSNDDAEEIKAVVIEYT